MKEQFNWLLRAIIECPHQRESWTELADFCQITGDNQLGYWAAKKALAIPESDCDFSYLANENVWKHQPHDIAAITGWYAFNPKQREECTEEAWKALTFSPWDQHLADNFKVCQNCVASPYMKLPAEVDVIILAYASLLLIDPWCHQDEKVYPNDTSNVSDDEGEKRFREVQDTFSKNSVVTVCRAFSVKAAEMVRPESRDFVYIDAIHTYEACLEDMRTWWPKVKKGGWMCGHDYQFQGVVKAVEQFCKENDLKLTFSTKEGAPSWAIQK